MRTISTLFLLFISITILAQTSFPEGSYMSLEELISQKPSANYSLKAERRSDGEILMKPGNDYKLTPNEKGLKRKVYNYDMFAYCDGRYLYLNGARLGFGQMYSKVESEGKVLLFFGKLSQSEQMGMSMIGGTAGGLAAASIDYTYAFNKESGEVIRVKMEKAKELLADTPDILSKYERLQEKEQKDDKNIMKYLSDWNESK